MERELIVERTKAELDAVRARGRLGGRPRVAQEKVAVQLRCIKVRTIILGRLKTQLGLNHRPCTDT